MDKYSTIQLNQNTKSMARFTGEKGVITQKNAEMYRDSTENKKQIRKLINNDSTQIIDIIKNIESITSDKEFSDIDKISEYLLKINLTDIIDVNSDLIYKPYYLDVSKSNKKYKVYICKKVHEYIKGEGYDNFNYSLNIIELYQILTNTKTYSQSLKKIINKTKIKINKKEEEFMNNEKIKYANNQLKIRNDISGYIYLERIIVDYKILLEEINFINLDTSVTKKKSYKNNNVFFAPVRVLEDRMQELCRQLDTTSKRMNKSNINKALNMFITLGLIKEVNVKNVKDQFVLEKRNPYFFNTKWYLLPELSDKVLTNANTIAENLINNKINISNISYESLKAFNKKLADEVYYNTKNVELSRLFMQMQLDTPDYI